MSSIHGRTRHAVAVKKPNEDWAVIVGICRYYPELGDLDSPENDAQAFYEWVTSPAPGGGGVPDDHAKLVLSSHYRKRRGVPVGMKPPTLEAVESHLIYLRNLAKARIEEGKGPRVGRRLYLYFSGHGCAPTRKETAILMANATRDCVYHLTGEPCADWFLFANRFEEVVLLMDCCSEPYSKVVRYVPPWVDINDDSDVDRSQIFYGFGTKWSRLARQRPFPSRGDPVRGVFTLALIDGLKGAAYDSKTEAKDDAVDALVADVTAGSLGNFLHVHMQDYLVDEDRRCACIAKEPKLLYDPVRAKDMVLSTVRVPTYPVTIRVPLEAVGKRLEIRGERFQKVAEWDLVSEEIKVSLARGLYEASVYGTHLRRDFEVPGIGGEAYVDLR